jgi:hypothetical protein
MRQLWTRASARVVWAQVVALPPQHAPLPARAEPEDHQGADCSGSRSEGGGMVSEARLPAVCPAHSALGAGEVEGRCLWLSGMNDDLPTKTAQTQIGRGNVRPPA